MDNKYDLAWFEQAWEEKWEEGRANHRQTWDQRAGQWEAKFRREGIRRQQNEQRIRDTAAWLRQRGLLTPEQDVADIGCGPGRFAAEFARTSRRVLGVDLSPRMTEYGQAFAVEQGLSNISFAAVDFQQADVRELGWENSFDLVFSSITPAVRGKRGLDNLLAMSRAWCYNSCFVHSYNRLHDQVLEQVFQRKPKACMTSHSHWFQELFNLLWLRGYYPRSDYYRQYRELPLAAEPETARELVEYLLPEAEQTPDNIRRVLAFLRRQADDRGQVVEISECWYGILLWDVREQLKPGAGRE